MYLCYCLGLADIRVKQIKKHYEERLRQARERGEVIEEPSESSSEADSEENGNEDSQRNGNEDSQRNGNEDQNQHKGLTNGSSQPDNEASVVTVQDDSIPPPLEDAPKQERDVRALTINYTHIVTLTT